MSSKSRTARHARRWGFGVGVAGAAVAAALTGVASAPVGPRRDPDDVLGPADRSDLAQAAQVFRAGPPGIASRRSPDRGLDSRRKPHRRHRSRLPPASRRTRLTCRRPTKRVWRMWTSERSKPIKGCSTPPRFPRG